MKKSTQTINMVGGMLFTFGLLSFIGSSFQQWSQYLVSQLGEIQRGPNDATKELYVAVEKREQSNRIAFLTLAVSGAGLALSKSKED